MISNVILMCSKILLVACIICTMLINPVFARENVIKEPKPISIFWGAVIVEGMFAANSLLATGSPRIYGIASGLLFPLGAVKLYPRYSTTAIIVSLTAAELLAAYNYSVLANSDYSRSEIFQNNMIAWHAWLAIAGTTYYLTHKSKSHRQYSVSYYPSVNGGNINFSYKF